MPFSIKIDRQARVNLSLHPIDWTFVLPGGVDPVQKRGGRSFQRCLSRFVYAIGEFPYFLDVTPVAIRFRKVAACRTDVADVLAHAVAIGVNDGDITVLALAPSQVVQLLREDVLRRE